MNKVKEFNYINSLGVPKKLIVSPMNEDGKYPFELREMLHGEWCGAGEFTPEKLDEWLTHYGLDNPFANKH